MGERTSPPDSLETLAWYLNFLPSDAAVPLNRISEETGLAWATVKKYADALETLQRVAPMITITSDGVECKGMNPVIQEILDEPEKASVVYLFTHAKAKGAPTDSVPLSLLRDHSPSLHKMEALGWIETTPEGVRLTPLGVGVAADLYADVRTADPEATRRRFRQQKIWTDYIPSLPTEEPLLGEPHGPDECKGHGPAGFLRPHEDNARDEADHESYMTSNVAATS